MATAQDMVNETQRLLAPVQRSIAVTLNGSYTAGATSLPYTDTSAGSINTQAILPGTVLSVDLELFLVTGSVSGGAIPVSGGYLGSTNVNHASGVLIYVNRRFTDFECLQQINHVFDSLCSTENGLYHPSQIEVVYNPVIEMYDLTDSNTSTAITGLIDLISIRYKTPFPDRKYRAIPLSQCELVPFGSTTLDTNFPSGFGLSIPRGGYPGQPINILFKQAFVHLSAYTDDATTKGLLPSTAVDLPPMGAMLRMVPPREVQRNQPYAQPDGRLATEVPPNAIQTSVNGVRGMYQQRVMEESARLRSLYESRQRGRR
jgi:hypothetical protein